MKYIMTMLATVMIATAHEVELAAATLILEAGVETMTGRKCVWEVIRNRMRKRGQTISQVILARKQFSCWNGVRNRAAEIERLRSHRLWTEAVLIVTHYKGNMTKGATHYHATYVSPKWAKGKTPCLTVGRHKFYNNVK